MIEFTIVNYAQRQSKQKIVFQTIDPHSEIECTSPTPFPHTKNQYSDIPLGGA